jgi:hypothetical protein
MHLRKHLEPRRTQKQKDSFRLSVNQSSLFLREQKNARLKFVQGVKTDGERGNCTAATKQGLQKCFGVIWPRKEMSISTVCISLASIVFIFVKPLREFRNPLLVKKQ